MAYLRLTAGGRLAGVLLATVGLCLGVVADGDAKPRKHRQTRAVKVVRDAPKRPVAPAQMSPRYAAIVVDAKSGRVLHEAAADAIRHPASLTKIMTLYVLFEELEARRLSMETELTASARAAIQAPSKLGIRPGQTIKVVDAIRALVTKSANDVAVVIAENISGSEEAFAARMTRTARHLGMASTLYRNASGLPNSEQVTTARDLALLGRAIQERFPTYYRFFSTPSFAWGRANFRNHNRLLGAVEGIDGIKTGYTLASGYNLVTSLRRDGRHLVAVVLGGPTARARDGRMAQLLSTYLPQASPGPQVSFVLDSNTRRPAVIAQAPSRPATAATKVEVITAFDPVRTGTVTRTPPAATRPVTTEVVTAPPPAIAAEQDQARPGWQIQVGAYDREDQAADRLSAIRTGRGSAFVAGAEPFTQPVAKGDKTLYRARFAGFEDRSAADHACGRLKRLSIDCITIHQ